MFGVYLVKQQPPCHLSLFWTVSLFLDGDFFFGGAGEGVFRNRKNWRHLGDNGPLLIQENCFLRGGVENFVYFRAVLEIFHCFTLLTLPPWCKIFPYQKNFAFTLSLAKWRHWEKRACDVNPNLFYLMIIRSSTSSFIIKFVSLPA